MGKKEALRSQIKAAERQAREEAMSKAPLKTTVRKAPARELKVPFDIWWMNVVRDLGLKAHMKEIIKADFRARGLTGEETVKRFNEALRAFGYTV
jgi:hypothetical protein